MSELLLYRYLDRQREIHVEVVCSKHYAQFSQPGGYMAPLSDREKQKHEQRVTAYTGDRSCAACQDEAAMAAETRGAA